MEIEVAHNGTIQKTTRECLPWVEKYRPSNLNDLISHTSILQTLNKFISEKKLPNLLFYGPPGTGKTSTIIACAKEMYGSTYNSMVLELNASDERGIGVVRDQIKDFASMQSSIGSFFVKSESRNVKLVILDEADSMTHAAQFALRRVIEKYASSTRFCLICNYVSKIIPALQSRCTRFKFNPIKLSEVSGRIMEIANTENLNLEESCISDIYRLCEGDMRKIVNMMQVSFTNNEVIVYIDKKR